VSIETVRAFLKEHAPDVEVIELDTPTSTVLLAATAHGVTPAQIAKTLSLRVRDKNVLVVTRGDARFDNRKAKLAFGTKARMLTVDEVVQFTGHPVGGVCPFGLATPMQIYCDVNLRSFEEVVPAAGSTHSAIRINPMRMAELVGATWIDVCALPSDGAPPEHPAAPS
jgi:prolyl-tRNA editing enzyme YbaK/EbsC (Cys-tRNA(Pro) deacylase)